MSLVGKTRKGIAAVGRQNISFLSTLTSASHLLWRESSSVTFFCAMVISVFSKILHMLFIYGFEFAVGSWEITLYNVPKWKLKQTLDEKTSPSMRRYIMTKHFEIYFGYWGYFSFFPDSHICSRLRFPALCSSLGSLGELLRNRFLGAHQYLIRFQGLGGLA